jgi:glutamine synthetase
MPLPPHSRGDATAADESLRFPATLAAATDKLARSQLARQVLPEAFIQHYVRTREWEVRQHAKSVSEWELERYFESI